MRIAEEIQAHAVFISRDQLPVRLRRGKHSYRIVQVVTSKPGPREAEPDRAILRLPNVPLSRREEIRLAVFFALVEGVIELGERIVFVAGMAGGDGLDSILASRVVPELEMFSSFPDICDLPEDLQPEVLRRVVTVASEIGVEGREGRPVGALFVVGDSGKVLTFCKQLILNPFQGYEEGRRNLMDAGIEETIKEFATIDGAFVVRGDGVIETCGVMLEAPDGACIVPHGLGARHCAAANITASTNALAVTVSQSTGTVTIFRRGKIVTQIHKTKILTLEAAAVG